MGVRCQLALFIQSLGATKETQIIQPKTSTSGLLNGAREAEKPPMQLQLPQKNAFESVEPVIGKSNNKRVPDNGIERQRGKKGDTKM